jgi:hypothetical protein
MSSRVVLAPRAARQDSFTPTDALRADAGVYAPAVARIFPRPHAAYFAAEPARRRAIRLIADRGPVRDAADLAEPLATQSMRRLLTTYLPQAPAGLPEALRRIVGDPWEPAQFAQLFSLLREGGDGAKVLRHAQEISRELVGVLATLPDALRRPRIVACLPSPALARLAVSAAKKASERADQTLGRIADRLERARSTPSLFRMLIDEIGIERLAPPPIPGTDWLVPIASAQQIRSAALRFENCLEGRIPWLLAGRGAYYEALGAEPAVVEIVRDAAGLWAVGEIRGHANADVSQALLVRIRTHLETHGARVNHCRPADGLAMALAAAAGW